jgi:hypothetical protein
LINAAPCNFTVLSINLQAAVYVLKLSLRGRICPRRGNRNVVAAHIWAWLIALDRATAKD